MPSYRLHDTTGDDLGTFEHPAPNVEPGDVVVLGDGRKALVTSRAETDGGRVAALPSSARESPARLRELRSLLLVSLLSATERVEVPATLGT